MDYNIHMKLQSFFVDLEKQQNNIIPKVKWTLYTWNLTAVKPVNQLL